MSWLSSSPTRRRLGRTVAIGGLAALLLVAGCAKKSTGTDNAKLKFDIGVTDTTIKLGVISDYTGTYKAAGSAVKQGRALFWESKGNKVCDRTVEFVERDSGYVVANGTTAYDAIKGDVLMLDELLGAPIIAAVKKKIGDDLMPTMATSWSSALLDNPYIVITGATYDIEMINGVDYLVKKGKIAKGDKVGHIYVAGEYGDNGLAGGRAAAKEYGLTLVEKKVVASDLSMAGPIAALKAEGVKAILLTTTVTQTGSAVKEAATAGLDVPFMGNSPTFLPTLFKDAVAKPLLEKNLLVSTSLAPYSSSAEGPAMVRSTFEAKYPDGARTAFVSFGYAQNQSVFEILDAACKKKDLTRVGVLAGLHSVKNLDTKGIVPALDYSKPSQIPARQTYIEKVDAADPGGLVVTNELYAANLATTYTSKP